MTVEKGWLQQQPLSPDDSPATPLRRSEDRPRRSRSPSWEADEPSTPLRGDQDVEAAAVLAAVEAAEASEAVAAADAADAADAAATAASTAAAAQDAAAAAAAARLALPKHLAFPCVAAEACFRGHLGRCAGLGELGLLGLQLVGFLAAAGEWH